VTTAHGPFLSECGRHYAAVAGRVPIIAISHHQAATVAGHLPVAAVIHHGLDLDAIRPSRHHRGYVLFLGRLHPDKGAATAARVARAAGVPLVIAAKMREPAERQYFDAEVRPLLGGGIDFVGEVGAADKFPLLRGAMALLNPIAWAEPFGMVMIDALACGTPVVAPPVATVPELVIDGVTGIVDQWQRWPLGSRPPPTSTAPPAGLTPRAASRWPGWPPITCVCTSACSTGRCPHGAS